MEITDKEYEDLYKAASAVLEKLKKQAGSAHEHAMRRSSDQDYKIAVGKLEIEIKKAEKYRGKDNRNLLKTHRRMLSDATANARDELK